MCVATPVYLCADPLKAMVSVAQCLSWLKGTVWTWIWYLLSHLTETSMWVVTAVGLSRVIFSIMKPGACRTSSVHVTPGIKQEKQAEMLISK